MDYLEKLKASARRNRDIVRCRILNMSMDKIAKKHGISRQRVHQILVRENGRLKANGAS